MQEIMNAGDIAFPHLGIYLENVPKSFSIFGFKIAYYGVIIGIGVLAGLLMAVHNAKKTKQDPDTYWDFAIYAIIFSIIGARLYYVAFSWELYKDDLLSILNTRNGGMAIYGAVIAAFVTLFIYAVIKKKNAFQMGDTAVPGLILGQIIGRWGNFMNREAFGEYTDNFLAMRLPIEAVRSGDISENIAAHIVEGTNYIQVHPTFLYESMWNLVIFSLLLLYGSHKKFHGEICLMYLGGYGLGRFLIEGLRTDQLLIPGTTIAVSQMLAMCMLVFAVMADVVIRQKLKKGKCGFLGLDRGVYLPEEVSEDRQ
ncbi:MAG: prolipoprotein diacylglyceryl transferase [Lachnospiraceae bacterium]|nr:prolipoprotein diacylglyceryl transferase [Lachnospiraceae bacterium]MBQ8233606.1 prolipoprotein diacylglyceryl transferase [Lachnospiraceae bacterium]